MKYTKYGLFATIGSFAFLSYYKNLDLVLVIILVISILMQKIMCKNCGNNFTMASYMTLLPIMQILFNTPLNFKKFVLGFSLAAAIGRIGCFFAGCCTGKLTNCKNGIKYEGNYCVNKKLNKKKVCVKPTIIYEIILQFLFFFIVKSFKNGYKFYGILNAILIILTKYWRLDSRMQSNDHLAPISLVLTSIICFIVVNKNKFMDVDMISIKPEINPFNVILPIIAGLIFSNDINIGTFIKN